MTTAPHPGGSASAVRAMRANRNFRLLWIAQVLSDLGTQIGAAVLPLALLFPATAAEV